MGRYTLINVIGAVLVTLFIFFPIIARAGQGFEVGAGISFPLRALKGVDNFHLILDEGMVSVTARTFTMQDTIYNYDQRDMSTTNIDNRQIDRSTHTSTTTTTTTTTNTTINQNTSVNVNGINAINGGIHIH